MHVLIANLFRNPNAEMQILARNAQATGKTLMVPR